MTPPIPSEAPDLAHAVAGLAPERRRDIALARAVAAEAGALLFGRAERGHGRHGAVHHKPDGSIVTAADFAADRLITARLHAERPDDVILSEESTAVHSGGRTWVVDPLDGTTNFAAGLPIWGVTLALLQDGAPTVGVSVFPSLGLDYTAIAGGGAFEGASRLRLGPASDARAVRGLGPDDLIAQCSRTAARWTLDLPATRRTLGSTAFHLAMVAAGTCVASVTVAAGIWDVAAGWLLVSEAGGVVTALDHSTPWPLDIGDWSLRRVSTIAAADTAAHLAVRRALAPAGDRPSVDRVA